MTKERFWEIVAASRAQWNPDDAEEARDAQIRRLHELLAELPVEEVRSFLDHFSDRIDEVHCPNSQEGLWAVAFDIGGGCSQDMFDDFRAWLISMGREVYEAGLRDPESVYEAAERAGLEDLGEDAIFFEELQYVPSQVLREKTGEDE